MQKISLNGQWAIYFDRNNKGLHDDWPNKGLPSDAGKSYIDVPSVWNSIEPKYTGAVFYEYEFDSPSIKSDEKLLITFHAVNYKAQVWVNSNNLGCHEGGYTPFSFDITESIKESGTNRLVVRVVDYPKQGEFDGCTIQHFPVAKETWYYNYGGIYGSVELSVLPSVYINDPTINTTLSDNSAHIGCIVFNNTDSQKSAAYKVCISNNENASVSCIERNVELLPGENRFEDILVIPAPCLWSPESPYLYKCDISIDTGLDIISKRIVFGMREVEISKGELLLNGEPIKVKGVLLQPNYPATLVYPTSRELMVREIRNVKEAGFNMIRSHVKPSCPDYLDICDEIGILVYQETPCAWVENLGSAMERCRNEIQELVKRDRNHPCIVMWGIFNENHNINESLRVELLKYIQGVDSSRPCIDNSGMSAATTWEILVWVEQARYIDSKTGGPAVIEDNHHYLPIPLDNQGYRWLQVLGDPAEMAKCTQYKETFDYRRERWHNRLMKEIVEQGNKIFVSEYGCGGVMNYKEVLSQYGNNTHLVDYTQYKEAYENFLVLMRKNGVMEKLGGEESVVLQDQHIQGQGILRQTEALRLNSRISGYVLTQLNDASFEHMAGIMDPWRNTKESYNYAKKANQELTVVFENYRSVIYSKQQIEIPVYIINDSSCSGEAMLEIQLSGPGSENIFEYVAAFNLHKGVHNSYPITFSCQNPGEYLLKAKIIKQDSDIAIKTEKLHVLERPDFSAVPVKAFVIGSLPGIRRIGLETAASIEDCDAILIGNISKEDSHLIKNALETCKTGKRTVILDQEPDAELFMDPKVGKGDLSTYKFDMEGLTGLLPCNIHIVNTQGNFVSNIHYILESNLTKGLFTNILVDERYKDISPVYSVCCDAEVEESAGTIVAIYSRHYHDIFKLAYGQGELVFCQYRIKNNLGKHPLADILLYNLLCSFD